MSTLEANLRPTGASLLGFDEHLTGFRHISSTFVRKGSLKADQFQVAECATWNCFFCPFFFCSVAAISYQLFSSTNVISHHLAKKKKKKIKKSLTLKHIFFLIFYFFN